VLWVPNDLDASWTFVRPRSGASGTKPRPPDPMMPDGSAGTVVGILIVGAPEVGFPPRGPGPSNVPRRGPAAIGPGSWIPVPEVPSQPLPPPRTTNGPGPDPPPRAMPPMMPKMPNTIGRTQAAISGEESRMMPKRILRRSVSQKIILRSRALRLPPTSCIMGFYLLTF